MVEAFDRIVITVAEFEADAAEFSCLLGIKPVCPPTNQGYAEALWFVLHNTVIELVPGPVEQARITGIVFAAAASGSVETPVAKSRGLDLRLCDGGATAAVRAQQAETGKDGRLRVDHLVLRTSSADDCIDLFSHRLGIRLALDQTVPEWGGRMLFFRAGKLTLEVIDSESDRPRQDYFWGIAFQCSDIAKTAIQLAASGVKLSEIRDGRKAGSRVATLKSHNLGIPTLLVESAK